MVTERVECSISTPHLSQKRLVTANKLQPEPDAAKGQPTPSDIVSEGSYREANDEGGDHVWTFPTAKNVPTNAPATAGTA